MTASRPRTSVDQLADDVEDGVRTIGDAVDDASDGSGILEAISTISGTLATMSDQVGGPSTSWSSSIPAGELTDALSNADECSSLRSGG